MILDDKYWTKDFGWSYSSILSNIFEVSLTRMYDPIYCHQFLSTLITQTISVILPAPVQGDPRVDLGTVLASHYDLSSMPADCGFFWTYEKIVDGAVTANNAQNEFINPDSSFWIVTTLATAQDH